MIAAHPHQSMGPARRAKGKAHAAMVKTGAVILERIQRTAANANAPDGHAHHACAWIGVNGKFYCRVDGRLVSKE